MTQPAHIIDEPAYNPTLRLGSWYVVLSLLVGLLIVIGGVVRITDSGLSIPEWPIINGSLLPPLTQSGWQTVYDTYYLRIHQVVVGQVAVADQKDLLSMGAFRTMFAIEYTHRLLAALVSILFLALLVQVMRQRDLRTRFGRRLGSLGGLLLLQAILGGIVVKFDLKSEFVTLHLGIAFVFFAAILWLGLLMAFPGALKSGSSSKLKILGWLAAGTVYLQVILGGLVASTKAGYLHNSWPHMGQSLVPANALLWSDSFKPIWLNVLQNQTLIQFVHRWWALVAVFAIVFLALASLKYQISARARFGVRAATSLVVLQFLLGVLTLVMVVPKGLAIMHLALALILFAILILITYETTYETNAC